MEALDYRRRAGALRVFGYVLLENHFHAILAAADLSAALRDFKSYTARRILDALREAGAARVLRRLAFVKKRHKSESDYQLWQEGSHLQQIIGAAMMRQKLEYIHANPVKRGYVDAPGDWRYSSARNYAGRNDGLIEIDLWEG